MKLKEINRDERPRERLLSKGACSLGNAELLAILLRTGSSRKNVLELAYELMAFSGNLTDLSTMTTEKMREIQGIGQDKAATIAAAFELGRRLVCEGSGNRKIPITMSSQIYSLMIPFMKGLDHEECWIIWLNRSNYILSKEKVSSGGLTSTVIDRNSILRKSLEKKASGIILVHNHPSGNPHPGTTDIKETEMLKKCADTFGISLVDHVIVCNDSWYSFADESISLANEKRI